MKPAVLLVIVLLARWRPSKLDPSRSVRLWMPIGKSPNRSSLQKRLRHPSNAPKEISTERITLRRRKLTCRIDCTFR